MNLLTDDQLERSAVVANCRMNRERGLVGSNGYGKELGLDPLIFLKERVASSRRISWLDLCCGSGKALIEAARIVHDDGFDPRIEIVGIDLVGMFLAPGPGLDGLRLVEASLSTWLPDRTFDLITCVHGLHYVGDKLGLIARAASWLVADGLFVANLDADNLKAPRGVRSSRPFLAALRGHGRDYDRKRKLVICRGHAALDLPLRYLGADDRAGPNYTGQPAVNSYYEPLESGR